MSTSLVGRQLGQYQVVGAIGRGGMADVYRGVQISIGREVAIKVLPAHFLQDSHFLERFNREVKIIAALQHPHILPVYDFGEQDGLPYIVMAYMRGGTLGERIQRGGGMPLDEVVRLVEQAASALDFAHEKRIIHRDFKPSNVLLDEKHNVYLSDFGIAKVTAETMQLTGSGLIGTPDYMAPEMGRRGGVTPLIDVYALAVTVYQMLTGEHPYAADTPMGVIIAHATQPVPDIRPLRPDLPADLQAVIEWGMAKDPAERVQSAGELASALRSAARGEGVTRPGPAPERTERILSPGPLEQTERAAPVLSPPPVVDRGETVSAARPRPAPPTWRRWMLVGGAIVGLLAVAGGIAAMGVGARLLAAFDLPASTAAATPLAEMALAEAGVKHNAEWTPYFKGVDGVRMALVPRGCFTMGSDVERDELPTTYNCFDRPFWIDVAEVTNGQFNRLGGTASRANNWTNDDYPRVNVDWREASDFCRLRGARLPSEAEWEYAARGPDSLVYPWGKDFVEDNVVSTHNSFGHPWPPGSRLGGVSWVGAEDLSGNVWEWTSSWRAPYPYVASDGRESEKNLGGYKARVTRGGSCSYSNAANLRAAYRGSSGPGLVSIYGGFRCVSSY